MEKKFECHITIPNWFKNGDTLDMVNKIAKDHNFKTSVIAGDPILGAGKWFYLSGYAKDSKVLLDKMLRVSDDLKRIGIKIEREKMEEIIYDTKTNHFICGETCTACLNT